MSEAKLYNNGFETLSPMEFALLAYWQGGWAEANCPMFEHKPPVPRGGKWLRAFRSLEEKEFVVGSQEGWWPNAAGYNAFSAVADNGAVTAYDR